MLINQTDNQGEAYSSTPPAGSETEASQSLPQSLPPAEAEQLIATLEKHGRKRRKYAVAVTWLKWSAISNVVAGLGIAGFGLWAGGNIAVPRIAWTDLTFMSESFTSSGGQSGVTLGGQWVLTVAAALICWLMVRTLTARQAGMSRQLPFVKDRRAIGPLVDALRLGDDILRAEAVEALTPLLNGLTEKDAHLLGKEQRDILHEELCAATGEFAYAILSAMERVGGEPDARLLEKFPNRKAIPPGELAARVEQCARAIRQRLEADKEKDRLLRPVETSADSDTLLRPVASTTHTDPATLLRPSE